jgi:[citrate (pro-3S)-lyase] ligase
MEKNFEREQAMYIETVNVLQGAKKEAWAGLLAKCGLEQAQVEHTVLVWEGEELVATGSREGNILKCIAVEDSCQGQGLLAVVITHLRQSAFQTGQSHLFLYTKPQNEYLFTSLFFHSIATLLSHVGIVQQKDLLQT